MIKNICTNNKKAFTLLELAVVLGVLSILAASIAPVFINQAFIRASQKTALEIGVIQESARGYYIDTETWPHSLAVLQTGGYLSGAWVAKNPWGNDYTINSAPKWFSVSTDVPDNWTTSIAASLPAASVSGQTVTSVIPIPGVAASIDPTPAGSILMWDPAFCAGTSCGADSCPVGFTRVSSLDNRFITGGPAFAANAGGSNTHSHAAGTYATVSHDHGGNTGGHALTISELPSHSHDIRTYAGMNVIGAWVSNNHMMIGQRTTSTETTGGNQAHSHAITGESLAVTGNSAAADSRPAYATVVMCQKD